MLECARSAKLLISILKGITVKVMKLLVKKCTNCKTEKNLSEFYKRQDGVCGVDSLCKLCRKAYGSNYYKLNKENCMITSKARYERNKDKLKIQNRINNKIWYKKNKDRKKVYVKNWRAENKERWRVYYNGWEKKRRSTNSQFSLKRNITTAISRSLNGNKNGRHWETLVDYTLERLRKHLKKQFTEGMSWDNYGKNGWWIDHIIPVSVFNFTKPEHHDFKKCWALKNLQPMWARDNMSKSNKIAKHFQPSLLI
jgi:hypothetical protein